MAAHRCQRRHRTYKAFAKCAYPKAVWVVGEGPYALLAHCRDLSVSLHREYAHALANKRQIDLHGCGGACHKSHEIIELGPLP